MFEIAEKMSFNLHKTHEELLDRDLLVMWLTQVTVEVEVEVLMKISQQSKNIYRQLLYLK